MRRYEAEGHRSARRAIRRRKFDWNDTTKQTGYTDKVNANDTTKLYDVPPCHYTYASHVPARLSVTAQFGDLSANPEHKSFDFLAGQDFSDQTASKADFEHAAEARRAACDLKREGIAFRYTSIGGTTMPLNGFNGMLIGDNQLHLTFEMPPNSPVDAPILDGLVAGKGFNYDTGEQLYQDAASNNFGPVSYSCMAHLTEMHQWLEEHPDQTAKGLSYRIPGALSRNLSPQSSAYSAEARTGLAPRSDSPVCMRPICHRDRTMARRDEVIGPVNLERERSLGH